jgi:hypothetical protein
MIHLTNDELNVEILDPVTDRARFGVRYCTGGYVFQVTDARHGPLLTGPTYPESFNWFDGQGIPDAFNLGPLPSSHTLHEALVIGIGICDTKARKVVRFCDWRITLGERNAEFSTTHDYEDVALSLVRTVSLERRTIRSHTHIRNTGKAFVPVRWFPHPFYPQPQTDELLWVNAPLRWRDAPDYALGRSGFIERRGWPWNEGHYLPLDHDATAPLVLLQRHPALGLVSATCSYVPDFFPVWGNAHTFSFEPFLERNVAPGQSFDWWIDYSF